jgi:hypothetical protein
MGTRAERLADRIEQGARDLLAAVEGLSEEAWRTVCPGDGRAVGVLVHHVASAYPAEAGLIATLASGGAVPGLTWAVVDRLNAQHAAAHAGVGQAETLDLLLRASAEAAATIRALDDAQLDRVAPTAVHWGAPLTVQYVIEQHPVAHPYIHLESIRAALEARPGR